MSSDIQESTVKKLFLVKQNGKYGYINGSGSIVIAPQFEQANDFSEGLARVSINGKYGFIDESGSIAIETQFNLASDFSEGLAYVWTAGKYGYIDRTGALTVAPQFDGASNFSEGLARVNVDGKDGFINRTGQVVISPVLFKGVAKFSEGLAAVQVDNKWGYVDETGRILIAPQFDAAGHFSEGLARVNYDYSPSLNKYGKWGFIDPAGQLIIKCEFDEADDFSEGLARVNVGGKHYSHGRGRQGGDHFYIDKTGKVIIDVNKCGVNEPVNLATNFSEGMARIEILENLTPDFQPQQSFIRSLFSRPSKNVSESSTEVKWRYGYISKEGEVAIKPQFDDAKDFQGGLAGVNIGYLPFSDTKRDGKWGYIDKSGAYVWEPTG